MRSNQLQVVADLQLKYSKKIIFFVLVTILSFLLFFPSSVKAEGRISIDTNKRYEGMGASFSKGYEPSIKKNTMTLVVPFVTDMEVADNRIIVGISFEREENSPFYYKNYQKKVKKKKGVYLYQCKIKLKEDRINGQYPLHLFVQAQTLEETILQDFTIYVEITDGETVVKTDGKKVEEPEDSIHETIPVEPELPEQIPEQIPETPTITEKINHQPRVLLIDNSLQGISLQAGDNSLWNISAKNCNRNQSIENMKVILSSDQKDIVFEKNSWYFERVGSGNTIDLSQSISVDKKATAQSVAIQFQFEYEDKEGNNYSSTEIVNISIRQPQQAELVNLLFPENIYESDTEALSFQIQNTGLAVIYNAKVRLEGKGLFPEKELFLGNMEGGTSLDGEIKVFVGTLDMDVDGNLIEEEEKYGETLATVIFSYEDEHGKIIEQSQKLSTQIKKPKIVELKVENEVQETNQWWITIVVIVIILLILIIIWLYIRMKHYQNMGNMVR